MMNSGQDGSTKNKQPIVRRVITRKVEISPAKQNNNTSNNNNPTSAFTTAPNVGVFVKAETANVSVRPQGFPKNQDEMFAFSVIAKIYLPKDRTEKISIAFQKMLLGKISFVTVSKTVSTNLSICPLLVNIWQKILNRNMAIKDPLFSKILEVIDWFRNKNASNAMISNFIAAIANAKQHSTPHLKLFENVVMRFEIVGNNLHTNQIMQLTLDLLKLLPQSRHPLRATILPVKLGSSFSEILQSKYLPKEFTIETQYSDISTFLMRNGKLKEHSAHRHVSARDTTFTPSHHLHTTPILDKQPCFFLNYLTKSLATGHEGGSRNHGDKHQELPLPPTRDIHDVLEQPEISEHIIDAMLYFDQDTNYIGHIARVAGLATYDEVTWRKIEPKLKCEAVRKYVSEQIRKRLSIYMNSHRDAEVLCDVFNETRPINLFLRSLRKPDNLVNFTFPFFDITSEVTAFAISVFGAYTSQRYPYLSFFFKQICPYLADNNSYMCLIGPPSMVMAFFYFSKLCEALIPLLSKEPSEFETYDSVFDIATDQINTSFEAGEQNNKFLAKVLKSIVKNGTILDDLSFDIYKHFNKKSCFVAQVAPILGFFNSACHCLVSEPKWEEMFKCLELFGSSESMERIKATFPIYSDRMRYPSGGIMFVIRCEKGSGVIFVEEML